MKNRFLLALLVAVVLAGGIVAVVIGYKLATLKGRLADDLGRALGAKVEVSTLSLDAWKGELHAAGIVLNNLQPDRPWERGEISQATVRFHWGDLFRPAQPLSLEVESWRLVLRTPVASAAAPPAESPTPAPPAPVATHRGVEVTAISAHEGEVEIDLGGARQVLLHKVGFDSGNNGGDTWTTQLRAGSIDAGTLLAGASSVQIRGDRDEVRFSDLRMQCGDGAITGEGEIGLGGAHAARAKLEATNVPVVMLVAVKWQMKLAGLASGSVSYTGDDGGGEARGNVTIAQGKLGFLPFLGQLSSALGLPDVTNMEFDHVTSDFAWKDRVLHLTNIDVRKNDVLRVNGMADVDAESRIDAHLKLGVPTTALGKWPQLQSAVFSTALENYGWTEVHVTGTPDHLQEDLSSRLLAVGVQSGGNLLNQGTQKAMDLFNNLMGK